VILVIVPVIPDVTLPITVPLGVARTLRRTAVTVAVVPEFVVTVVLGILTGTVAALWRYAFDTHPVEPSGSCTLDQVPLFESTVTSVPLNNPEITVPFGAARTLSFVAVTVAAALLLLVLVVVAGVIARYCVATHAVVPSLSVTLVQVPCD
jgi:hypothetical protein